MYAKKGSFNDLHPTGVLIVLQVCVGFHLFIQNAKELL
jgi:hypothetical protein